MKEIPKGMIKESVNRIVQILNGEKSFDYLVEVVSEAGDRKDPDLLQVVLRDLLTDIRHFAEAKKLDFHKACDSSYEAYCEERSPRLVRTCSKL